MARPRTASLSRSAQAEAIKQLVRDHPGACLLIDNDFWELTRGDDFPDLPEGASAEEERAWDAAFCLATSHDYPAWHLPSDLLHLLAEMLGLKPEYV